jgi:hypothetical protein
MRVPGFEIEASGDLADSRRQQPDLAWTRGFDTSHYDEGQLERAWYRAQAPQTETPGDPKRGDHFYYDALGNRTGWNEVASRGAMLFNGKNNGLNQYFSWNNSYPVGDLQHWGTTINYDDDVGGKRGAPQAANGVLMQDGWITAGYNALNQPVSMWSKMYSNTSTWMYVGYYPLGRVVKRWKSPTWDPNTPAATFFYFRAERIENARRPSGSATRILSGANISAGG